MRLFHASCFADARVYSYFLGTSYFMGVQQEQILCLFILCLFICLLFEKDCDAVSQDKKNQRFEDGTSFARDRI